MMKWNATFEMIHEGTPVDFSQYLELTKHACGLLRLRRRDNPTFDECRIRWNDPADKPSYTELPNDLAVGMRIRLIGCNKILPMSKCEVLQVRSMACGALVAKYTGIWFDCVLEWDTGSRDKYGVPIYSGDLVYDIGRCGFVHADMVGEEWAAVFAPTDIWILSRYPDSFQVLPVESV